MTRAPDPYRCPVCGADGAEYAINAEGWRYACTAKKGHPSWLVPNKV